MKRIVSAASLACILAASAAALSAESRPSLSGQVAGIELCPQFICGFALFVGQFEGDLNSRAVDGAFAGAVTHEPLPDVFDSALVTGGEWRIIANRRVIEGRVSGGAIYNLDGTQFCVEMQLEVTSGGRGELHFTGLLDHNPFPPTIGGFVTQEFVGCSGLLLSRPD